jgi:hypothetical protein
MRLSNAEVYRIPSDFYARFAYNLQVLRMRWNSLTPREKVKSFTAGFFLVMSFSLMSAIFLKRMFFPDDDELPEVDYSAPDDLIAALPKKIWSTANNNKEDDGRENLYEQMSCAICLGDYEEGEELTVLPCNHSFHAECVTEWLHTRNKCPLCCSVLALERGEVCVQKPDAAEALGAVAYSYEPPTEIQLEVDEEEQQEEEDSEESGLLSNSRANNDEDGDGNTHNNNASSEVENDQGNDSDNENDNDSNEGENQNLSHVTLGESSRSRFAAVFSQFFGTTLGVQGTNANGVDIDDNELELPLLEQ